MMSMSYHKVNRGSQVVRYFLYHAIVMSMLYQLDFIEDLGTYHSGWKTFALSCHCDVPVLSLG